MNFQLPRLNYYCLIFIICLLIGLLGYLAIGLLSKSSAFTMSNSNYIIQMGNFNNIAGISSGGGKTLNITVGETAPGLYTQSGVNYKVRAGFQYINSIIYFRFKITGISATFIDFGTLDANSPVTRTNDLIINNGSAGGYQVTAQENHELLSPPTGSLIVNTTCDNGLCTNTISDVWTSSSTYGFGYRCDNVTGTDCASGFASANNYKQFAKNPTATSVMSGTNVGRNKEVTITYKVNVAPIQPSGQYTNIITYVATPTF